MVVGGDPKREAVRRLRILCTFSSVAPLIGMVLMIIFTPEGSPIRASRELYLASIVGIVALSIAVNHVLGRQDIPLARRLDIGFGYQVMGALGVATMRHIVPWAPGDGFREVSPVAILIVLFAALIPNVPRRTFFASLCAAAMEPVGLGISLAMGNPTPSPAQIFAICIGPLAAVAAATIISQVVYGLAQDVEAARRLGSYRLVSKLGAGGMGEVWRAEHDLLARPAAVKLIQPKGDGDGKTSDLSRFEREAQATALLQSPHTVQLYDFGSSDDGTFYYVMELLDGVDLEQLVRETGPLPPARAVHVLVQVCKSLDEAHAHGLVHRDVKPANVLLCRYGRELDFAKVLDFGLVKPAHDKDKQGFGATVTAANAIVGTPAYMAPEMVLSGEVDHRADVYSLGCVAYWLLTGRLVFEGDSLVKLAVQHLHDAPRPPSELCDHELPPALEQLILDCLAKDPVKRPASVEEIERRLLVIAAACPWSQDDARAFWDAHPLAAVAATAAALAPTEEAASPRPAA